MAARRDSTCLWGLYIVAYAFQNDVEAYYDLWDN